MLSPLSPISWGISVDSSQLAKVHGISKHHHLQEETPTILGSPQVGKTSCIFSEKPGNSEHLLWNFNIFGNIFLVNVRSCQISCFFLATPHPKERLTPAISSYFFIAWLKVWGKALWHQRDRMWWWAKTLHYIFGHPDPFGSGGKLTLFKESCTWHQSRDAPSNSMSSDTNKPSGSYQYAIHILASHRVSWQDYCWPLPVSLSYSFSHGLWHPPSQATAFRLLSHASGWRPRSAPNGRCPT